MLGRVVVQGQQARLEWLMSADWLTLTGVVSPWAAALVQGMDE